MFLRVMLTKQSHRIG